MVDEIAFQRRRCVHDPYLIYPRQRPPKISAVENNGSKSYSRPAPHPIKDRAAFLEGLRRINGRKPSGEAGYNTNGGTVIAMGFERWSTEESQRQQAIKDEAERQRREREDQRIVWGE